MGKTSASGVVQESEKVGNGSPSSPTKGKRGRKGSQIIANKKYPLRSAHSSARVLRSTSKDKSKTPNEPVSPLRSAHSSPRVLRSTPKNKSKTPKKQVNSLRSAHSSARVLSSTLKKKVPNEPVNDSTAAQPAARKRKRGRPSNAASPKNECIKIRQRVRYILNRMNYEQSFIQAYAGEGWKGQSLEKIRPEKELERAKAEILRCKLRIREAFRNMDSLLLEGKLDESLFDSEGEISSEDIFCAICASKHVTLKNDIILCDGVCDRGFHQKCLNPPLLAEDIPQGDEGWLCPACDCKLDCIDLLNELQGSTLAIHDSWEKVFPESTSNGLNQIGASDLPSDDSEEDYDPTLAEGDTVDENKSSAEDGDEGSDSDDLDFITSSDESEPSKKKRSESKNKNTVNDLALPSDDSEDDDFDPEGPNSSEDQKTKTNSDESDFTSDSDDFCAEISKSSGKDKVSAPSFSDQTNGVDIMEAELEQDSVLPASNRRQVGHLDYKKLYDEAYGKETTDSSDEEEWSGHSPNGNPEDSDTDSFAGPLKPAKTRRARGGHQNNERTPQSERHSGSVSEQHPEVLSNGTSSTVRKKGYGPIVNQKLKAYFEKEPYPSRPAKESLAQELGLTFNQITRWFSSTRHYSRVTAAKKGKRSENYTAENNGIAADSIQQREPNDSLLGKPNVDRNGIVSEERMAQKNLDEGEKEDTPFRQHISCEQTLDGTPANKHNTANSREVDSPIGAPGGNQQSGTSRNAEDTPLGQDIGCEQTVVAVNQNCTIGSSNVGSPKGVPGGNKRLNNSPRSVGSPRRGSAEKNIPGLEHVDEARRKAILRELRKMKAAGR
ncbi:homeobox protein HAZ1 [Aegilops tauschii subsp. strangulata]|uniref:Homeobox protein HOX1A n=3 Tax=Triticinae TaxID=1648030 RepID=A0A453FEA8_AEGTS|nr:homeobox protein HAZ1 [Aegilops tauschii subsp. strangulata]XP_020179247.1 homeobox protein HAZ1 [Aegilops tauschii subsp. strangulata]XP_044357625.1 homeobox protein HAZ1-like [Triticum aestivum]XP_044357626.1 homeobox protein HAZ1-like [Triticum aestivum]XP_045090833.1 homeobox protein HAZ1 [Aegilops tauschii subsp. strangulata]